MIKKKKNIHILEVVVAGQVERATRSVVVAGQRTPAERGGGADGSINSCVCGQPLDFSFRQILQKEFPGSREQLLEG